MKFALLFFLLDLTYNKFGVEGCKALGEALKTNTSLTLLDLYLNNNKKLSLLAHLIFVSYGANLETKVQKQLEKG